jgi:hypothetical protein
MHAATPWQRWNRAIFRRAELDVRHENIWNKSSSSQPLLLFYCKCLFMYCLSRNMILLSFSTLLSSSASSSGHEIFRPAWE